MRKVFTLIFIDLLVLVTVDLPKWILDTCYKQSRYLGVVSHPSKDLIHFICMEKNLCCCLSPWLRFFSMLKFPPFPVVGQISLLPV